MKKKEAKPNELRFLKLKLQSNYVCKDTAQAKSFVNDTQLLKAVTTNGKTESKCRLIRGTAVSEHDVEV